MWVSQLEAAQRRAVLDLAARAAATDGVNPLNEEANLSLSNRSADHFLVGDADLALGYLNWHPSHRTGQLVVDPAHRRQGIGRGLVAALAQRTAGVRLWAFGDLPAAQGFVAALELRPQRVLLMMERRLTPPDTGDASFAPLGLRLCGYDPDDAEALLELNAAAFAHHPEQGSLDAAGLAARMAEPWFDPDGLILAFDEAGLAGFHWTKRHDAEHGEVYVIAVAPRTQGRGLGAILLEAGLAHLAAGGARRAVLYVDSAEERAVRMYGRAGFIVAHRDVLYASDPEEAP